MNSTTAKECPFCGSADISDGEVWTTTEESENTKTQSMCNGCGALGPEATLTGDMLDYGDCAAIEAWNTRAIPSTPEQAEEPVLWYDASAAPHEDHGELIDGARQIAILGTTKGPFGSYITPLYANRAVVQPMAALPNELNALRYPATMTAALADVLRLMTFRTGPIAHVYRAAGAEIRTKCEDEQAFVLDRFLRLALEHGDGWRAAAESDLKAAHTLAEENKAVGS